MDMQEVVRKAVQDAHARQAEEERQKRFDALERIQSAAFDRASAYTSVVLGLGYAAFFTVWSLMKSHLSNLQMLVVAVSISISLISFVTFTVAAGTAHGVNLLRLAKALDSSSGGKTFDTAMESARKAEYRLNRKMTLWWLISFVIAVLAALIGAGVLLWAFGYQTWMEFQAV